MKQGNSTGLELQTLQLPVLFVQSQTGAWLAQTIQRIRLRQYVLALVKDQYTNCQAAVIYIYLIRKDKKNESITRSFPKAIYPSSSWKVRLMCWRLWLWALCRLVGLLLKGVWRSLRRCLSRVKKFGS